MHRLCAFLLASPDSGANKRTEACLKRYFVTGGTGFVGNALLQRLVKRPGAAFWRVRRPDKVLPAGVVPVVASFNRIFAVGSLTGRVDTVVHCAARVHVMNETASDPLSEFRGQCRADARSRACRYRRRCNAVHFP